MTTSTAVQSRDATPADLDAVLAMMRDFYAEDRLHFDAERTAGALATVLADPACGVMLLLGERGADGYIALTRGFSLEQDGHFALLDELYVAPHARGRGLGAAALAVAITRARQWGVARLRLEVNHHNPRAKALYLRSGFVDDQRDLLTLALDKTP